MCVYVYIEKCRNFITPAYSATCHVQILRHSWNKRVNEKNVVTFLLPQICKRYKIDVYQWSKAGQTICCDVTIRNVTYKADII